MSIFGTCVLWNILGKHWILLLLQCSANQFKRLDITILIQRQLNGPQLAPAGIISIELGQECWCDELRQSGR